MPRVLSGFSRSFSKRLVLAICTLCVCVVKMIGWMRLI